MNPDAPALVFGDREVSYRDLDAESNTLARELINRGVGPGTYVALALSRSLESVTATWAVAKTGGAFLRSIRTTPRIVFGTCSPIREL